MAKYCMISLSTGYSWEYNLKHPWVFFLHIYYEIKFFIQRGLYGYSNYDYLGLDAYLCHWMPTAFRSMKGVSYPMGLTSKKWENILEKTAVGFESALKIIDLDYDYTNKKEYKKLVKKHKEGFELFYKYFMNLWV